MIKVSVIVPVYNVEPYIKRCIQSIQKQTLPEFECLIIDDASPDASIAHIQPIIEKDKRFRVIYHTRNKGLGPARNTGIENARAEYVCFVDSDDTVEPDYLRLLYNTVVNNNADMANCAYYIVQGNSKIKKIHNINSHTWQHAIRNILTGKDIGHSWYRIYKKSLFKAMQFPRGYYEDCGAIATLIVKNRINTIPYVITPLYNYMQNTSSITHTVTPRKMLHYFKNILIPVINIVHRNSNLENIQRTLQNFLFIKLSGIVINIHRYSQNVIAELISLNRMIRKYIPTRLLYHMHYSAFFTTETVQTYGWKRILVYFFMYILHVKFSTLGIVLVLIFHAIFKVIIPTY